MTKSQAKKECLAYLVSSCHHNEAMGVCEDSDNCRTHDDKLRIAEAWVELAEEFRRRSDR